MTYREMVEINNSFWDTVDFKKFMSDDQCISVRDLMDCIETYYDKSHPELLPQEFEGYFFNFMNEEDFAIYLRKRYGYGVRREVIEKYYLVDMLK